jgi:hypothetical protein
MEAIVLIQDEVVLLLSHSHPGAFHQVLRSVAMETCI